MNDSVRDSADQENIRASFVFDENRKYVTSQEHSLTDFTGLGAVFGVVGLE